MADLHQQLSSSSYIQPGTYNNNNNINNNNFLRPDSGNTTTHHHHHHHFPRQISGYSVGSALSTIDGLHGVYISKCSLFGIEEDKNISRKLQYFDEHRAREFDFSDIRVGESFRCVLDALIAAPEIESLVWRRGNLEDSHVEAIVNAARRFIGLHEIDLGENEKISDVGGALILQLVGKYANSNNIHNGFGHNSGNSHDSPLLQRPPQLVRLDQTNVSFEMQAKIANAISTPLAKSSSNNNNNKNGSSNNVNIMNRRRSGNNTTSSQNKNRDNNNNNALVNTLKPHQNISAAMVNSNTGGRNRFVSSSSNNNSNSMIIKSATNTTQTNSSSSSTIPSRITSACSVLSHLSQIHSFFCSFLAIALWIPHNRFKTLIYCFCYFVGVALTFGPQSGVIDTIAISLILIAVQRWRKYYASQLHHSSTKMISSFTSSSSSNNMNGSNTSTDNVFFTHFVHLSQGARQRWSHFLLPLEELTNVLEAANTKKASVLNLLTQQSSSSSVKNNNTEDQLLQQEIEEQLIFFEQIVRNCTYQYTQFLLDTFINETNNNNNELNMMKDSSSSSSQTRLVLIITAAFSLCSAIIIRLITGQSAYAIAAIFVIFGALYFGSEPITASSFYSSLLISGSGGGMKQYHQQQGGGGGMSVNASSVLSISAIIKFYRVRIGRWIAGNPVTSADDDDVRDQTVGRSGVAGTHSISLITNNANMNTNIATNGRKTPFSFVVEVLRIEDAIIRTTTSTSVADDNYNNSNNSAITTVAPLAKIRCMNKSWTSSEGDTHRTFSKSTNSCITTSASWHPESSTVFHSPHPFDTAKMTFSIYDCNNSNTRHDEINNHHQDNYNNNNNALHQHTSTSSGHHHHLHQHENDLSAPNNINSLSVLSVLLTGTYLIDDDLIFDEEIAIPLKNTWKETHNEEVGGSSSSHAVTDNSKGILFGASAAASNGLWSLSEKLLYQIDRRDADERIRHHVPHNSYTNGNHHQHQQYSSSSSHTHHHHGGAGGTSTKWSTLATSHYDREPSSLKDYSIERTGRLIVKFTKVSSSISSDQTQSPVMNNNATTSSQSNVRETAATSHQMKTRQKPPLASSLPPSSSVSPVPRSNNRKPSAISQQQEEEEEQQQKISSSLSRQVESLVVEKNHDDNEMNNNRNGNRQEQVEEDPLSKVEEISVTSSMNENNNNNNNNDQNSFSSSTIRPINGNTTINSTTAATVLSAEALHQHDTNNSSSSPSNTKKKATFKQSTATESQKQNVGVKGNYDDKSNNNNIKKKRPSTSMGSNVPRAPRSEQSEVSVQFLPDEGH